MNIKTKPQNITITNFKTKTKLIKDELNPAN
jgi:hypothetical protein